MKTFAERLKYAMGESGLNQSTLSERTGGTWSRSAIGTRCTATGWHT